MRLELESRHFRHWVGFSFLALSLASTHTDKKCLLSRFIKATGVNLFLFLLFLLLFLSFPSRRLIIFLFWFKLRLKLRLSFSWDGICKLFVKKKMTALHYSTIDFQIQLQRRDRERGVYYYLAQRCSQSLGQGCFSLDLLKV